MKELIIKANDDRILNAIRDYILNSSSSSDISGKRPNEYITLRGTLRSHKAIPITLIDVQEEKDLILININI